MKVETTLENLKKRFPNEPEYFQAVEEVLHSIEEEYNKHPEFEANNLINVVNVVGNLAVHTAAIGKVALRICILCRANGHRKYNGQHKENRNNCQ